ncbi:MAG: AAA family ATPase [Chloroflexota bacterium]
MLKSLEVKNFRLFQHLEVKRLARINLIVGKNNVGKSALLEALQLYITNAAPSTLLTILQDRDEVWRSEAQLELRSDFGYYVRHLFFNRQFIDTEQGDIVIGDPDNDKRLLITTPNQCNEHHKEYDGSHSALGPSLMIFADKHARQISLDKHINDITNTKSFIGLSRYERWDIVPTSNIPSSRLAAMWNLTSLMSLGDEVINTLKLIEPKISGLAFIENVSDIIAPSFKGNANGASDYRQINRIPVVKLEGIDEPLPLKHMGEGVTQLFQIVLTLVNVKDGILLIDEFENGMYWGIQPKVWAIVFDLAERLNVQVFATTHSRDCIEGFERAWRENPELGAFFRLTRKSDHVKVTEYHLETLSNAIEMDVETR